MMNQSQLQPDRDSIVKDCSCDSWLVNIDKINNLFMVAWVHGIRYEGAKFEYCPWCGKQLEVRKDTDESVAA